MRRLKEAMCDVRDAPHICGDIVNWGYVAYQIGLKASELHPAVYENAGRGATVAMHVDDVLCVGPRKSSIGCLRP